MVATLPQLEILSYLIEHKKNLIMSSISVADLEFGLREDPNCTSYSSAVIRKALDGLLAFKLVAYGVKVGATYTYYVTAGGIEYFKYASGQSTPSTKK